MLNELSQLFVFTSKAIIIVVLALVLLLGIVAILSRGKEKLRGKISIKNLNKKYLATQDALLEEILPKEKFKQHLKDQKKAEKAKKKLSESAQKNIYVLNFNGDIKASAVGALREEVTALLGVATTSDEVVVKIESGGGMVHAYGLAASQLLRIREENIPLTVIVDKVAASGGYMMAAVANKILAAPFAIIGSIGVIVQLPNFHRLLKEKKIDFEQLTAGDFKRTITLFGHNTEEGREKMLEEIEDIHQLFKNLIKEHRPEIDINKVATGEHWLGSQALDLKLVDGLKTSDDYLFSQSKNAQLYEVCFYTKKTFVEKFSSAASLFGRRSIEDRYIM
ncbi:MAG: protease SohB [Gammaproteobacteria bacterium]